MSKLYKLTIDVNYLPSWGQWEAIRELLQNAKDAETQHGASMKVEYKVRRVNKQEVGALVITNDGCTMPLKALLIGNTTKLNDSDTIGQFGEGLKFGMLALLRSGLKIKIRNGSEVWEPRIVYDDDFGTEVLGVEVSTGRKDDNRVQFEIIGVSKVTYDQAISRCLWLGMTPACVETYSGQLILDPEYAGKIFVKGIYVCSIEGEFGYNFYHANVDRDRKMIEDKEYAIQKVLAKAANDSTYGIAVCNHIFDHLKKGSNLTNGIHYQVESEAIDRIADSFYREYGQGTIPCDTTEEVAELAHLGSRGAVVPRTLRLTLGYKTGKTPGDIIKALKLNDKHTYFLTDLLNSELEVYEKISQMVNRALANLEEVDRVTPQNLLVVDFHQDSLMGTYQSSKKTVRLARKLLGGDGMEALGVLVHELAHKYGDDGKKDHEEGMRNLFVEIIRSQLEKN